MSTLTLGQEHKLKKRSIAQKMPFTFEKPIEGPKIPICNGTYVKAEIKFALKPSGTFEIGPGAEQKSLEEWMKKFADVLIADVVDVKDFFDPVAFAQDFDADTLNQDGLTLPEMKFKGNKEVKISWKVQGTFHNSGIKIALEAILLALKGDDGNVDVKPPSIELKAGKDLLALPPIKLSDDVTAKASVAVSATLSVEPSWGAIAAWLIEEGIIDFALDAFLIFFAFYAPLKEAYVTMMAIVKEKQDYERVPIDAGLFVKGYLEGLHAEELADSSFRDGLDFQGKTLYDAGFQQGVECQKKTADEMEDWWRPLNAAGKNPYKDWLAKKRGDIEASAKVEATKQARRAAWVSFNEEKSPSFPDQENWWIYVFSGQFPKDVGEVDIFLKYVPSYERPSLRSRGWI